MFAYIIPAIVLALAGFIIYKRVKRNPAKPEAGSAGSGGNVKTDVPKAAE